MDLKNLMDRQQEKQKHLSREHSEPLKHHHGQLVIIPAKHTIQNHVEFTHTQYVQCTFPKVARFEMCTSDTTCRPYSFLDVMLCIHPCLLYVTRSEKTRHIAHSIEILVSIFLKTSTIELTYLQVLERALRFELERFVRDHATSTENEK